MKKTTKYTIVMFIGAFIAGLANHLLDYAIPIKLVGFGLIGYAVARREIAIDEESYKRGYDVGLREGKIMSQHVSSAIAL